MNRPVKKLLRGFIFIFIISALALWIAKIPFIKFYGFEAVFFSVIFGLIIKNLFHIPEWLKPAIQGEYFIKIGVVCLGATILFRDVMKSGSMGLLQAILVVTIVWFFAYFISRKLKVDRATAMTLSSGLSICGVSACITAARVAGTDDKKLSYIVSVVLIVVVPMIYLMPWLAEMIIPLFTSDPVIQQEIAGAWIGGTIDTTSGVAASSEMAFAELGDLANKTAVIVKATQNVLIGFVAFFIALYLSTKGENGQSQRPSFGIVWEKFPKFIIGFVAASLIFSLCQSGEIFPDFAKAKLAETSLAKTFSQLFFALAFVCIGLDTNLKDIISRENRNTLFSFLIAQCFNIVITFVLAYLLFGVIKPSLDKSDQNKEKYYKTEISRIIQDANVPLIQLEYISPKEKISVQVENPAYYDSLKIAAGEAVTPQPAIFQAASLSKVVFAYIVMKLHENGEIDLDKPICEYTNIDRFADKERAKMLTPRIVLNHRTGLPNWSTGPSSEEWPTSTIEFSFATDSCFGYSGEGFAFLQRAVEEIKGKDIDAIAKEIVFEPLGMEHTSYSWLPIYDSLAVDGYNKAGENRGKGRHPRANVGYTLRTCAADYSKFVQALLNGTGLKPETFATMFETTTGPAFRYRDNNREWDKPIAWAMGIGTEDNANHGKILWHWGDNGNFKALFIVIPAEKTTLVYFTNSAYGHDIINPLTELLLGDPSPLTISDWINKK